jgi:hypothetical protein
MIESGLMLNILLYWHLGHECSHGVHAEIGKGRVPLHTAWVGFQELNLPTYNSHETYPEFEAQVSHAWVAFQFECPCSGLRGQPVEVSRGLTDFE